MSGKGRRERGRGGATGAKQQASAPAASLPYEFEWTDAAISKFVGGDESLLHEPVADADVYPSDLAPLSERVKPLEISHLQRLKQLQGPDPKGKDELAKERHDARLRGMDLSRALLDILDEWLENDAEGRLVASRTYTVPLHFYDDSSLETSSVEELLQQQKPQEQEKQGSVTNEGGNAGDDGDGALEEKKQAPSPPPTEGDVDVMAAALIPAMGADPQDSPQGAFKIGQWVRCMVSGYSPRNGGQYTVTLSGSGETAQLHRVYVCFETEDRFAYARRVLSALSRRRKCEALLRYHFFVKNMPLDPTLISVLSDEDEGRIVDLAMSAVDSIFADSARELAQEARTEYQAAMNRLVFNANLQHGADAASMEPLALPEPELLGLTTLPKETESTGAAAAAAAEAEAVDEHSTASALSSGGPVGAAAAAARAAIAARIAAATRPEPPSVGVVQVPSYNYERQYERFHDRTFLSTSQAAMAVENSIAECQRITRQTLFATDFLAAMTLDRYNRMQSETLGQAVRVLRHEWPQRIANDIRSLLLTMESPRRFDPDMRDTAEYTANDCGMRRLLERVNFVMRDVLNEVMRRNLVEYREFVTRLCEPLVVVRSPADVTVSYSPEYLPEWKKALFSLKVRISPTEVMVNKDAVTEAQRKIEEWHRSEAAAEDGATCPISEVKPIMGHVFEYDVDTNRFEMCVLAALDQCIFEFQSVPHVQRYVMERIFWPEPVLIPAITGEEGWAVELRTEVSDAMKRATLPLTAYLQTFDPWWKFLNLNVNKYLSEMNHVTMDIEEEEEESDEEEEAAAAAAAADAAAAGTAPDGGAGTAAAGAGAGAVGGEGGVAASSGNEAMASSGAGSSSGSAGNGAHHATAGGTTNASGANGQQQQSQQGAGGEGGGAGTAGPATGDAGSGDQVLEGNTPAVVVMSPEERRRLRQARAEARRRAHLEKLLASDSVPVIVDLKQLRSVLARHRADIAEIEEKIPEASCECGLYAVNTGSVRSILLGKHNDIINRLLADHVLHCSTVAHWLDRRYKKLSERLSKRPKSIEEVTELQEFLEGVKVSTDPLEEALETMMENNELLDEYKFRVDLPHVHQKWNVFGWPSRIHAKCEEAAVIIQQSKDRYLDDMLRDQEEYNEFLIKLDAEVNGFAEYEDIAEVENIAEQVDSVQRKLNDAEEKSRLYNSREALFDREITEYHQLSRMKRTFEPYSHLWKTANDWFINYRAWVDGPFEDMDPEVVESTVDRFASTINKAVRFFERAEREVQAKIAQKVRDEINAFKPDVPLVSCLRNPGMRERHWKKINETFGLSLDPSADLRLRQLMDMGLREHLETITKISESAAKEYQIEQALDKMLGEWDEMMLDIFPYRETGTGVLKGVDDIMNVLDEHVTMTQAMQFSAFKGPFEDRIDDWNQKLYTVSEVLEAWLAVQRNWLYLQPIFESADINKQLPAEGKKFAMVDKNWRQTISSAKSNPKVLLFCDNEKLLERFRESVIMLDQVQKGLSDYLETKRSAFARFYFLSNDELLSILSESKDVMRVQPHLKKCFEGIDKMRFQSDLTIDQMISPEGEKVDLVSTIDPKEKNVEDWMLEVEAMMKASMRDQMAQAIDDYVKTERIEWMQKWPGMCVLNGSQMHWTQETEELLANEGEKGPQTMLKRQLAQLDDMVILVRGELDKNTRTAVGALTVIDTHARDVMKKLVDQKVANKNDFAWTSQLRYYWEPDDNQLFAEMVAARRPYGYEYVGNSFRLVITPLTDRCYLTLMGALQMILGGAPAGPAGTGKTETVKDLSKALAMQCVVFNCSDGLDYIAMGKFFKGLASCGAWSCFDEFNRINIEVLSVIGQQIMTIQLALRGGETTINFEGSEIAVSAGFGVFITMNPGYAGRTELPDSLKALFRPVAMMVPDYALIGEIMFFAFGFETAAECGAKMVTTFKLCSEQLSSQPHYDYGMRAVKTVITAAGNLKRAEPDSDEMVLLLRALQDVNYPKFLKMDLPLFEGIISDLFPGRKRPDLDYGALMATMTNVVEDKGLQPVPFFTTKVIQLYEMIVVRHGLMVVGPTGGGKSSNIAVLQDTLSRLKKQGVEGFAYENVKIYQLNPKAITMGQMYGEFDPNTHEWQDGIMSTLYRGAAASQSSDRKWMLFDGPVDALWIENMNTVLDDNKKLCLASGEIVKMSPEMTMMFEPEDLAVASPATVSRVGIIYMEPSGLGVDVLVQSWMQGLPPCLGMEFKIKLQLLFDLYMIPCTTFMRQNLKELVPTVNNNVSSSLMRILDCYFEPFEPREDREPPTADALKALSNHLEALFIFALVWSVGCTVDEAGRAHFDAMLRAELSANGSEWIPPTKGSVYDYVFLPDRAKWVTWMDTAPEFTVNSRAAFQDIIVPTMDSVRNTYLLDLLLAHEKHILMVGETGTGKSVNIAQYLQGSAKVMGEAISSSIIPLAITFSAQTSANMTQDMLDSKMEKRRKGVYGPAAGRRFVVHVDDMNMPKREFYGAQPPIELLRQWFDQCGWYDRKELTFRRIVDVTLVGSMGPPGGGRQEVTARFLRHFNVIGYVEMSDDSKKLIFGTILRDFLGGFDGGIVSLTDSVVNASIDMFNTITQQLLPTPSKSHYTFNLRDLAKVFQGVLMGEPKRINMPEQLARLWVHESKRVFEDRLVNDDDHAWFRTMTTRLLEEHFGMDWDTVVPRERLIYGDYMNPQSDTRLYDEVADMDDFKSVMDDVLAEYNADTKTPMPLVLFLDALEHVSRIARILRQPLGNALLLGVGGSGRQSMTKLATAVVGYKLFQVEIVKGYGVADWREDIKNCLLNAGLKEQPVTFLFSDVQVIDDIMLEDVNNILNAGDVPNLYPPEDMDQIMQVCRVDCQKKRIPPTKLNIYTQFVARVRRNTHVCLCMSPVGDVFRDRLRMFPSLVNCCTIDWFTNWPAEALLGVGRSTLTEKDLGLDEHLENVVDTFRVIHQSVEVLSAEYWEVLRRRNYVTPTSYLELLASFNSLLDFKREEVNTMRQRLQIGLDKLSSTKDQVATMQLELQELQPQLVKTQAEVAEMMENIKVDKAQADETKAKVEVDEKNANEKAAAAKLIADDAQRDLDEALPALEAAVRCLNELKKSDIDEVKSLRTPPEGVRLTMMVCCHMFDVRPVKKNDPNTPGKKIDDYWEAAQKSLLTDAKSFMERLVTFDKDNIPDRVITRVDPFIEMEAFTPEAIAKASKACTAICMWARAMHKYHFVAKAVAPKRARLKEAEAELAVVMEQLADARARLKEVMDRLAVLEANFQEAMERQKDLVEREQRCKTQLSNAEKLIGGLGGEEARWRETVSSLNDQFTNIVGDVLVSAGTISYLGPFTFDFRSKVVTQWQEHLERQEIPHTPGCDLENTLVDPVLLRTWRVHGLPTDSLSTQNGIVMAKARRWPLLIDPQGQANRFIKNMGKNKEMCENTMEVVKLSDKNFLRALENGVQFGRWVLLENIGQELDAALEPILLQQKFKVSGQWMMKIGDSTIPYNDSFRFFLTTKLPNPLYAPEVQVKVSLLNFTITQDGLEEQLLNVVVSEEMPDLAEKKNELVVQNAAMNKQLYDIESQILQLLSKSEGNILDDTVLIDTLAQAKTTSEEIKEKMKEAEETEAEIASQSENYRPVAKRASLLYFCIADLGNVDPMYQYALPWYTQLFVRAIAAAEAADNMDQRVLNLNDTFTYSIYVNVCRSLFEMHKLLFSFLLTIKIMQGDDRVDPLEWRFLISGMSPSAADTPSPKADWITAGMWADMCALEGLPCFRGFTAKFVQNLNGWQRVFDSNDPHLERFPAPYDHLEPLRAMCILRCLRRDKCMNSVQQFVMDEMGRRFVEPPPFDLRSCYVDSTVTTPLIFVLSSGSDPNKDLLTLADSMGMMDKLRSIALGQGQGAKASAMIERGQAQGDWVLLQNCHLSVSWMPELERIVEELEPTKIHPDFRLWLTSMPSKAFPTAVLQNGVKMTKEPPAGLRANLKSTYTRFDDEKLQRTNKPEAFQRLLFGLAFFHAVVIERKKFGPLGWNVPYEYNDTDLDISHAQLELYVNSYEEIPYQVLQQLTSVVNYGGRITDDKDLRTVGIIIDDFFRPSILTDDYAFSKSGIYKSIKPNAEAPHQSYMDYIESLPLNAEPEVFGMHANASITSAISETEENFAIVVSLQPRVGGKGGISREDQIIDLAKAMLERLPQPYDVEAVGMMYPTDYNQCLNTVLVQESQRFTKLTTAMHASLRAIQKALRGLVVLSSELEAMGNALFDQQVPGLWAAKAYPSLQPLTPWYDDLLRRLRFFNDWIERGVPPAFWISAFFFPQGFLTANLQNHARKYEMPVDTVSFTFNMKDESPEELTTKPEDGCFIHGLFLEGARWDKQLKTLVDPKPKELFSLMPAIHLLPTQNRAQPTGGIYRCPVYKILTRTGTLSTTGHSTNFVVWLEIPSTNEATVFRTALVSETNAQIQLCDITEWTKGGVACFMSLRF